MAKVSLIKCSSYDQSEVDSAIQQTLAAMGGLESFVKLGQKVLIKPNLLMSAEPDKGITTHPTIVKSVIKAVKQLGAIPLVGDSPGFELSKRAVEKCGFLQVINEEQAIFCDFGQGKEVEFKEGFVCKKIFLAKELLGCDVIINLAKLKTHGFIGITAAVKNLFGCIPGLLKSQLHLRYPNKNDFDLMLLDLLRIIKPAINIVDAVVVMEGEGGPTTGNLRKMNLIACGTDAVAVDAVCALLTGKQPQDFNFLRLAGTKNVGETDQSKIEIIGENIQNNICHDFKHIEIQREQMIPRWIPQCIINYAR
ncbi:MAG: DUF362 domain-containing protein, partial [Candidatus Margulisbacteria bacterium]|nr:DUF362 domain-containing protein [Candidatus Margulisiibacteriota bacterium]